jgi:hypothetical protein
LPCRVARAVHYSKAVQGLAPGEISMSIIRARSVAPVILASLAVSLNGCAIIGGIFKAGVWVGVIAVALVVGLLFALVRMVGGSR